MNVLSQMVDVRRYVQIPMDHLSAPVIKDICYVMIKGHVQVLIIDIIITYPTNSLIDINECTINNGGCEQTCVNNVGTYNCHCRHGYNLNLDNHTCKGELD